MENDDPETVTNVIFYRWDRYAYIFSYVLHLELLNNAASIERDSLSRAELSDLVPHHQRS